MKHSLTHILSTPVYSMLTSPLTPSKSASSSSNTTPNQTFPWSVRTSKPPPSTPNSRRSPSSAMTSRRGTPSRWRRRPTIRLSTSTLIWGTGLHSETKTIRAVGHTYLGWRMGHQSQVGIHNSREWWLGRVFSWVNLLSLISMRRTRLQKY